MTHLTRFNRRLRNEAEAAAYCGVAQATLRKWRWAGCGPAYHKLGRAVRYDDSDLDDFLAAARRTSTSDPGPDDVED